MARAARRVPRGLVALTLTVSIGAVAPVLTPAAPAAAVETAVIPGSGSVTVEGHGNGHGHGLSQYGARGAAMAGLTAQQIVGFYYPGTVLTTLPTTVVRVQISAALPDTVVRSGADITVGTSSNTVLVASLPTAGTSRYRLVPSGTGLRVDSYTNAVWRVVKDGLPASAFFRSANGYVRLFRTDGSTDYRGAVGAVRSGSGTVTVNRVKLDDYTMGVVPREMPSSWEAQAVKAQAIAARSYGRQAVESHTGSDWDICDTTMCQVYGGMTHYDSAGNVLWRDYPAAVQGNENLVVRYGDATAFTQFSASDGGWTAAGNKPYLTAKADPYDNTASGDPYLSWSYDVPVGRLAGYYGLSRVTSVAISERDGNGDWGGRVQYGYVTGTDSSGAARTIGTTGFGLQYAMGLPTEWFHFRATTTPPGAPTNVSAAPSDGGAFVSWSPPASNGGSAVTGYRLDFGATSITVGPGVRRAFAGPLLNGTAASVSVRTLTAVGASSAATVSTTPKAAPQTLHALTPARLFDTRSLGTVVTSAAPFSFVVPGRGGVPSGARAVQLALTIVDPSADGTLRVHTSGTRAADTALIAFTGRVSTTTTLTVPLVSSGKVVFEVLGGASVRLLADVMAYSGTGGSVVQARTPVLLGSYANTPTGSGVAVQVRAAAGTDATAVVLRLNGTSSTAAGWLRVWPSGTSYGPIHAAIRRYSVNAGTAIVPIGADGTVRLAANVAGISSQVTLIGVLGPAATGRGPVESYQQVGIADDAVTPDTSLTVGGTARTVTLTGTPQIPKTGVQAVLLAVTVTASPGGGSLWIWGSGSTRPPTRVAGFGASRTSTTTTLVPVGTDGAVVLQTSGPDVRVALDSIGYVTR